MDHKVNSKSQIDYITKKSAQILGFLKRYTKGQKQIITNSILYNALVRSNLEFSFVFFESVVWNSQYAVHLQRIESIQRVFTKCLVFTTNTISPRSSYDPRLKCYNMYYVNVDGHAIQFSFINWQITDLITMNLSHAPQQLYPIEYLDI